ncbi:hypothetical protein JCM8097_007450 [Rhodosporidiobolus ruineniae]
MDRQELVDRLVTAVAEQDTLYVLVWVDRAAHSEELSLAEAVETNHSWKGHSALVAAILEAYTPVRQLILEILLFQLEQDPVETLAYGVAKMRSEWAVGIMVRWKSVGKAQAQNAYNLLHVGLVPAEEWIQEKLLAPSHFETLTGEGPLPPPPPAPIRRRPLRHESVDAGSHGSRSAEERRSNSTSPSSSSTLSSSPRVTFPSREKPVRVHIGHFPSGTSLNDAVSLLDSTCIAFSTPETKRGGRSFYTTVRSPVDYRRVSSALHGESYGSSTLLVERTPPKSLHGCPAVAVHNLPPSFSLAELQKLVRETRTGSAEEELGTSDGGRTVVGVFRAPSPASAQEAVERLDGRVEGGRVLRAEWRKASMRRGGEEGTVRGPLAAASGGGAVEILGGEEEEDRKPRQRPPASSSSPSSSISARSHTPQHRPLPLSERARTTATDPEGAPPDEDDEEDLEVHPVLRRAPDVLDLTATISPSPSPTPPPAKKAKKATRADKARAIEASPASQEGGGTGDGERRAPGFKGRYCEAWAAGGASFEWDRAGEGGGGGGGGKRQRK